MSTKIQKFVAGRDAVGDARGGRTTPKAVSPGRRAKASALRVTQKDIKGLPKKEPSSQKLPVSDLADYRQELSQKFPTNEHYNQTDQQGHSDEYETNGQGLFDQVSVAAEDFDETKSSFEHNGYGAHGYQNGIHNGHRQDFLQDGQEYMGQDAEQNQDEYEDESEQSDEDGHAHVDDDRTLEIFQAVQQDPAYNAFRANSGPFRTNGPSHFAAQQLPPNGSINHQQIATNEQQSAYKTPLSTYHHADQKRQHETNRLSSPVAHLAERRRNGRSPIEQENDWGQRSDGLSSQDQRGTSPHAPTVNNAEALLRTPSGPATDPPYQEDFEPLQPDYDEEVLYNMNYAALKDQPFDAKPGEHLTNKPSGIPPAEASLDERLAAVSKQTQEHQADYFSRMSKEEWEKSGDWFIDQFTNLMQQMKVARQSKRDVSKRFEDEIAAREEAVRGKIVGIDRVLREMKTGGEGVLRRKI